MTTENNKTKHDADWSATLGNVKDAQNLTCSHVARKWGSFLSILNLNSTHLHLTEGNSMLCFGRWGIKKKKSSKNNLLEAYSILRSIQGSRSFQQNEVW